MRQAERPGERGPIARRTPDGPAASGSSRPRNCSAEAPALSFVNPTPTANSRSRSPKPRALWPGTGSPRPSSRTAAAGLRSAPTQLVEAAHALPETSDRSDVRPRSQPKAQPKPYETTRLDQPLTARRRLRRPALNSDEGQDAHPARPRTPAAYPASSQPPSARGIEKRTRPPLEETAAEGLRSAPAPSAATADEVTATAPDALGLPSARSTPRPRAPGPTHRNCCPRTTRPRPRTPNGPSRWPQVGPCESVVRLRRTRPR